VSKKAYTQRADFARVNLLTGLITVASGLGFAAPIKCPTDKAYEFGEAVVVEPPVLADLTYTLTSGNYLNMRWDTFLPAPIADWTEPAASTTLAPVMDVYMPSGSPPSGGWPAIIHDFPSGSTKAIAGGGSVDLNLKQIALAAGVVLISRNVPHPAILVSGTPQTTDLDIWGKCNQFIRAVCPALSINPAKLMTLGRSRGNYSLVAAMRQDLQSVVAATYAGRQSSFIPYHYGVNTQAYYDSSEAAKAFLIDPTSPTELATFYANFGTPRALPCAALMVATAPQRPKVAIVYDASFPSGRQTAAAIGSNSHYPGSGLKLKQAFTEAGLEDDFVCWDNEEAGGDTEELRDAVEWFLQLLQGASSKQAMATARARRRGTALFFLPTNFAGLYGATDGTNFGTPLTTVGQNLGGIYDASQGIEARTVATPPVGKPLAQATAGNKPVISTFANGKLAILFDSNDRMATALANVAQTQPGYSWGQNTADSAYARFDVPSLNTNLGVSFGQPQLTNYKVGLIVADDTAGDIKANDVKIYDQFAKQITGHEFFTFPVLT